jgi:hypothetical protein
VAAYENLLRKIIIKAPHAALLSLAVAAWKLDEVGAGNKPPFTRVPNPFWNTGAVDAVRIAVSYCCWRYTQL